MKRHKYPSHADDSYCITPKSDPKVTLVPQNINSVNIESNATVKPQIDPEKTSLKQKIIYDSSTDNIVCVACSEPCSDSMLKCNGCNLKIQCECTGLPRYEIVKYWAINQENMNTRDPRI